MLRLKRLLKRQSQPPPIHATTAQSRRLTIAATPQLDWALDTIEVSPTDVITPPRRVWIQDEPKPADPPVEIDPFPSYFPTDVFRIIVDFYVEECRSRQNLRGISHLMRASRLLLVWLGPRLYRFVELTTYDQLWSFCQSYSLARKYTKAITITLDPGTVQASNMVRSILFLLEGSLEKLCLPQGIVVPATARTGPVFVHDLTVLYHWKTQPGHLRCKRLRLTVSMPDILTKMAPHVNYLPFDSGSWSPLHYHLSSFAFELANDDVDTLSTVYRIAERINFSALRECVAIIYFPDEAHLKEFRGHGQSLAAIPWVPSHPSKLKVVYLLYSEHAEWTFSALEEQRVDFWTKIATRYEKLH